jgi:hypothetical protein
MVDIASKAPMDIRTRKIQRLGTLETNRAPFFSLWRDIADHLLPLSGRFQTTDRDRASKSRYNKLYDNTATAAWRVAKAGIANGVSSESRLWFRMQTKDPDLNEFHTVRMWLDEVTERMMRVFAGSNVYRSLEKLYGDLLAWGTGAQIVLSDFEDVIRLYHSPLGEFSIAHNHRCAVDTLYRKFRMSVGEAAEEFGLEQLSVRTQQLYRRGEVDAPVEILHTVEPRRDIDPTKIDAVNMPFDSCWIELEKESGGSLLRQSGFQRFPVLAPRWDPEGNNVYGFSPGMEALGDIRQLQMEQIQKGQSIHAKVDPALQLPNELKDQENETLPGGRFYYDQMTPHGGVRKAIDDNLDLRDMLLDIGQVQARISRAFFEDLFLMLSNAPDAGREKTAYEMALRQEEKIVQLGPMIGRLRNEAHKPLIDLTFDRMFDLEMFPPMPEELGDQDRAIEFLGLFDQAQKAIGLNAVERWTSSLAAASEFKPEALDRWNADKWAEDMAERLGVPTELVVPEDEARQLREARSRAEAAQAQIEAAQGQAKAVRDLAGAPTTGDNALSELVGAGARGVA